MELKNLIFDGAMGSLLIEESGCDIGYPLELLNLEMPQVVRNIHLRYKQSGADIITTNTFGANHYKYGEKLESVINSAIILAKSVLSKYVAFDIGPLGKVIGEGGISFDEAYQQYKKIALLIKDVDFVLIETMTSLAETRAAVLAVKENTNYPIFVSMSFEKNLRTFFGVSIESFVISMEALSVQAVGANCSVGPVQMLDIAKQLVANTHLPIFIQPNAGMPKIVEGKACYDVDEQGFFEAMKSIRELGIDILGGCCGTTPEYVEKIAKLKNIEAKRTYPTLPFRVCSATTACAFTDFVVIGERINPTGKKALKKALIDGVYDYAVSLGVEQQKQGAHILDVNCGMSEIDETQRLVAVTELLQDVVGLPLQIDTSNPVALEKALRVYNGKALINSVNGSQESLDKVLPLAKKYGAGIIGLTLDDNGIPATVEQRLEIAEKILLQCEKVGICKENVIIDALTLAESSGVGNALTTINTVKALSERGIKTVLGVSNISFGMPNRVDINAKFLELTKKAGLSSAIINPQLLGYEGSSYAEDYLLAKPSASEKYIEFATNMPVIALSNNVDATLKECILCGQKELSRQKAIELLATTSALDIAKNHIIPALDEAGKLFDQAKLFLPQLIASAEAAKEALSIVEAKLSSEGGAVNSKVFVLATVKGDIHDIGKNIVKAVVSNYGYKVVDLGRDVDYKRVLDTVEKHYPCVLGLSALMTTTAQNMQATVMLVRQKYPELPILVGGAVITQSFAESIGAIYCKDASATVKHLQALDSFFGCN